MSEQKNTILYFEFLDFYEDSKEPRIIEITINNIKKEINKNIIIFNETFYKPFDSCIYLHIPILCRFSNQKIVEFLLTIYLCKINYFKGFYYGIFNNSFEFIKTSIFPLDNFQIELINKEKKYIIKCEEEFEKNSNRKRINIFNFDLNVINKINFKKIENQLELLDTNNILVVLDDKMKILGAHFKSITPNLNIKFDMTKKIKLLEIFKTLNFLFEKNSLDKNFEINNEKYKILCKIVYDIKNKLIYNNFFSKYMETNLEYINFNKIDYEIYRIYGIYYLILKTLDYSQNKNIINVLEYLINNLLSFEKQCKYINNELIQSKLFFVSALTLSDFIQIYFENNSYETFLSEKKPLISLIDFEEDNIYKLANINNIKFINNLNQSSYIFYYLLQFDSGFSINIFYDYYESSTMISMLTLNELKEDLLKCIPKFGIRVFFDNGDIAFTELIRGITVINEFKIFKKQLNANELKNEFDNNYYKRFIISFLLKHERMGHFKHTINKSDLSNKNSPRIYYNILEKKIHFFNICEIGNSLEFFFGNFDLYFYNNLFELYSYKEIMFTNLFENINLWTDKSPEKLIKEFNKIYDFIKGKIKSGEIKEEDNELNINKNENKFIKEKKRNLNTINNGKEKDDFDFTYCIKRHKLNLKIEVKEINMV